LPDDKEAKGCFRIFRRSLPQTANQMGIFMTPDTADKMIVLRDPVFGSAGRLQDIEDPAFPRRTADGTADEKIAAPDNLALCDPDFFVCIQSW
jgi:hypothetical protein